MLKLLITLRVPSNSLNYIASYPDQSSATLHVYSYLASNLWADNY